MGGYKGSSASPPTRANVGGASAEVSPPARAVTLPELRAMAHLPQKANRRVAQLGLTDSSELISDSGREDLKSLKSGKEAKITSTVL